MIQGFRGEYFFLSNFFSHPQRLGGIEFATAEHAFQASKCAKPVDVQRIHHAHTPSLAKRLGRKVDLRPDWEEVKYEAMLNVLRSKFSDPALADKLLATGSQTLVEENNWGDREWGTVNGVGKNKLGFLLMRVREEIRSESLDSD